MELHEQVELHDCSICGGTGLLEEDGTTVSVTCLDCGAHTVSVSFASAADAHRLDAARRASALWNTGKVISEGVGE